MSHKNNVGVPSLAGFANKRTPWGAPVPALSLSKGLAAVARPGKLLLVALALLAASVPLLIQAQNSTTLTESLPSGPIQQKATTACLECHEARIILQQRLNKPAWTKEVDKMTKWGALVDASDRDALIDYLSTNFNPDKPPYVPPRTSQEKISSKTATK